MLGLMRSLKHPGSSHFSTSRSCHCIVNTALFFFFLSPGGLFSHEKVGSGQKGRSCAVVISHALVAVSDSERTGQKAYG